MSTPARESRLRSPGRGTPRSAWLAVLLVVGLAACGLPSSPSGPAVSDPVRTGSPAGDIAVWAFGDAEEQHLFETLQAAYRQLNSRVSVRLTILPGQNDYMTRLSASFGSGAPPDVFLVNYRRYAQFADRGALEPLEPWLQRSTLKRDDFFDVPLRAFSYGGVLQCLPQNQSSLVVYYNLDLFKYFGVPIPTNDWTWEQFLLAAQRLTRDTDGDRRVDVHGLGLEPSIVRAAPFIWQNGGRLVDDDARPTRLTLDEPLSQAALSFMAALSLRYQVTPTEAEFRAEDLDSRFMTGKLGMLLNSRRVVPEFRRIRDFAWDVAPLPGRAERATVLHSDAYCMSAASSHKDAAWDFIAFAAGPAGQEITARLGRSVPSLKSIAASPAFLDPSQPPASSQVFLDQAAYLRLLPVHREWPAIERALNEELERAIFGLAPFDEALTAAQRRGSAPLRRGQ